MKLNSSKLQKNGEYATATLTIDNLLKASRAGKVLIPEEQRKMEAKNATYKKKAQKFIAYLLTIAFKASDIIENTSKVLINTFGNGIKIVHGVPQLIGITIDEKGYIYLSDGQHRFLNYLEDFLHGVLVIKNGTDFGGNFVNKSMSDIFNAIELEDGDGSSESDKIISVDVLSEEDLNKMLSLNITASIVNSKDFEERAYSFISMNSSTAMSRNDIDRATYIQYPMWNAIESVHGSLKAVKEGEPVRFGNEKYYDSKAANVLKFLFYGNGKLGSFVPFVAHMGLLTFLPKKQVEKYQWKYNSAQVDQIRNFFLATENMTLEECYNFLFEIMDGIIKIGSSCYNDNTIMMAQAKSLRCLIVGQLYADRELNEKKIPSRHFKEISSRITEQILTNIGYTVIGEKNKGQTFISDDFNNTHYNRKKNELFYHFLSDEYKVEKGDK